MPEANRDRVLVVSRRPDVRNELVTLLSGYGYYVEYAHTRSEGIRKFRAHKQPIVILDPSVLRTFSKRLFRLIHRLRENTIVLIAAHKNEEPLAFEKMALGAYDILNLPLKTDALRLTLSRALSHHRITLENVFVKNVVFFVLLTVPIWLLMAYLLVH